ncbi:MAG: hypothetical protein A3F74_05885 [Betaproteobacteria bacterium RIFCSPLOWO2_12_FULL_62_58]|nr:MAG: hypothetical protein A3F74_05885 [Betaproteobacteria bacterium RIFCSPLOWO2_12_FULL_62_58]
MPDPEISKLRRLSLGLGLIVLLWAAAGVTLDATPSIQTFGLPLRISRPDLFPACLAVLAVIAALRYYYYGLMLGTSPYRRRRDLLDGLAPAKGRRPTHMYWGHTSFESTPWRSEFDKQESLAANLVQSFPKFARARVIAAVTSDSFFGDDGESHRSYAVVVTIPIRCRLAALLEDLDYTAPVWFPALAVVFLLLK